MLERVKHFSELVKLEHTLFGLPFAFIGGFLAAGGFPSFQKLLWITLAFTGARSGAMAFNRWADAFYDSMNPRTKRRPIQMGLVKRGEALLFSIASYTLFVLSARMLGDLCFKLSFVAVAILSFYSFTKRFTSLSHFILGVCLAASPVGAWIAIRNSLDPGIVIVGIGVLFWVAGFDIIYSLLDIEFDKKMGLFSIPSKLGVGPSILLSRLCHAVFYICLVLCGIYFHLGKIYWAGLLVVLVFLIYEHSLVRENDASRVNAAFFNANASISVFLFLTVVLDHYLAL